MPNKNTPPKHKTQNWKLVTHEHRARNIWGHERLYSVSIWQAVPLRSDRKDLS